MIDPMLKPLMVIYWTDLIFLSLLNPIRLISLEICVYRTSDWSIMHHASYAPLTRWNVHQQEQEINPNINMVKVDRDERGLPPTSNQPTRARVIQHNEHPNHLMWRATQVLLKTTKHCKLQQAMGASAWRQRTLWLHAALKSACVLTWNWHTWTQRMSLLWVFMKSAYIRPLPIFLHVFLPRMMMLQQSIFLEQLSHKHTTH